MSKRCQWRHFMSVATWCVYVVQKHKSFEQKHNLLDPFFVSSFYWDPDAMACISAQTLVMHCTQQRPRVFSSIHMHRHDKKKYTYQMKRKKIQANSRTEMKWREWNYTYYVHKCGAFMKKKCIPIHIEARWICVKRETDATHCKYTHSHARTKFKRTKERRSRRLKKKLKRTKKK